jgi:hypothetical protein
MRASFSLLATSALFSATSVSAGVNNAGDQEPLRPAIDPLKYKAACPDYKNYAMRQQYVLAYQVVSGCANLNSQPSLQQWFT